MANINESEKVMTVFYSPTTGKIKAICGGYQDMNYFGEDSSDYNYNYIIVEYDLNLFYNYFDYRYENGKIVYNGPQVINPIKYKEEE